MTEPLRVAGVTRRRFLQGLAAGSLALASGCGPERNTLNFYNWANYIGEDTIPDFQRKTGIQVNYENFSSQDELFAKLKIGVTGYDLVVATDYMVRRLLKHRLLMPLRGLSLEGLSSRFRETPWDPEHRYSVPYLWGTTGLAYNRSRVRPAPTSYDSLWDPRYAKRIAMLDEKRDTIGCALLRLGYSGNSIDPRELEEALKTLLEQKKLVKTYSSDMIDDLARGEFHLALGWSGDVGQARDSNDEVDYLIPREGGFMFVDCLCVPDGAPHPEAAIRFIHYVTQPRVMADITNLVGYPNAIEAS
ncbi:MAG: spermidine/putrescine ABC transporter substrate-binding protein, partial [Candidatus Eremiobacterota bacterium]